MADKRLTYDLTANDNASSAFRKVAAEGEASHTRIGKSADAAGKQIGLLTTAIAAVGPALVPVAAGAIAAGASLGALGVTGLLAFQGIKKEMADGTPVGKAYAANLDVLKTDLDTLERTAAKGVLTGFDSAVNSVHGLLPLVNQDVQGLSGKLGDIVSHVMPGLVTLFTAANPLLLDFADDLDKGAAKFEQWTKSSDGATQFVAYAREQLPKVEDVVLSLATSVGHLAQGFAPLGGVTLTWIGAFSKLINAIPVSTLQTLAPLITGTVLAIKGFQVADAAAVSLTKLGVSLGVVTVAEDAAAASSAALLRGLGPLALTAGAVVGGVELLKTVFPSLSDILSNHVVPSTRSAGTEIIQLSNAYRETHDGISGTAQQLIAWGTSAEGARAFTQDFAGSQKDLNTAIGDLRNQLPAATTSTNTLKTAQGEAKITIDGVTTSIDKQTTASGLLKGALDRLNGTSLSLEQTQNQFLDTLAGLQKRTHDYNGTLSQTNTTGRANREVIVNALNAANQHAQAVADETAKTKGLAAGLRAGSTDLKNHEDAIRKAAAAAGLDKDQVDALIRSIGKIPRSVTSNVAVSGYGAAIGNLARVKAQLDALHGKTISVDVVTNYYTGANKLTAGSAGTNLAQRAGGGPVNRGTPYIVGEEGPEVFMPDTSGTIVPTATSGTAMGGITVVVNNYGSVIHENDLVDKITVGIDKARRRRGRGSLLDA